MLTFNMDVELDALNVGIPPNIHRSIAITVHFYLLAFLLL